MDLFKILGIAEIKMCNIIGKGRKIGKTDFKAF